MKTEDTKKAILIVASYKHIPTTILLDLCKQINFTIFTDISDIAEAISWGISSILNEDEYKDFIQSHGCYDEYVIVLKDIKKILEQNY